MARRRISPGCIHLTTQPLRQRQRGGDRIGIIEWAKSVAIFGGHAPSRNSQSRSNPFEPLERRRVDLHPVSGDILESGSEVADLRRGLPAATVKEKPEDFLIALDRQEVSDCANALRVMAAVD